MPIGGIEAYSELPSNSLFQAFLCVLREPWRPLRLKEAEENAKNAMVRKGRQGLGIRDARRPFDNAIGCFSFVE